MGGATVFKDLAPNSELKQWTFLIPTQKGLTISLIEYQIAGLSWKRLPSFLEYKYNNPLKISVAQHEKSLFALPDGRHMILMDETLDP